MLSAQVSAELERIKGTDGGYEEVRAALVEERGRNSVNASKLEIMETLKSTLSTDKDYAQAQLKRAEETLREERALHKEAAAAKVRTREALMRKLRGVVWIVEAPTRT